MPLYFWSLYVLSLVVPIFIKIITSISFSDIFYYNVDILRYYCFFLSFGPTYIFYVELIVSSNFLYYFLSYLWMKNVFFMFLFLPPYLTSYCCKTVLVSEIALESFLNYFNSFWYFCSSVKFWKQTDSLPEELEFDTLFDSSKSSILTGFYSGIYIYISILGCFYSSQFYSCKPINSWFKLVYWSFNYNVRYCVW